ncbi:BTAD domain-containing putative transcriptional regulator [Streptomyces sp. NPDC032472]|uniref:AfsR/SARP family transcriptional regulator n=1 Tax=Streptomyces sp. NPDC032472 TaxID=3155018 RepID=UPI0033E873BA
MRYLILGATEARDAAGAPVPIGGARLRALLTALALRAGGPAAASVADLVDEVWGDDPPQDAPAALQALVARLRRTLGGRDTVLADPAGGYRLTVADRDDIDLHRFTRLARLGRDELPTAPDRAAATLRTALCLWRGPALADLAEPARTAHASAPQAHRTAALRDRIEADLRAGSADPAGLLPEIEALIRQSPYDETLRAQQLRALRAAGRPAEALAAYERTRRTLADTLGTDPGPELATLHAELLRPTTTGAPLPAGAPAPGPPAGTAPAGALPAGALAGGVPSAGALPAGPPPGEPLVAGVLSAGAPVPEAASAGALPAGALAGGAPALGALAGGAASAGALPAGPSPGGPLVAGVPAAGVPAPGAPAGALSAGAPVPQAASAGALPAGALAGGAAAAGAAAAGAPVGGAAAGGAVPAGSPPDMHPGPTAAGPAGGNLRPRLNSFVGREAELAALHCDLAGLRLVTLTGPGGSGKTRLAEQAAAAHPEPGWLVELARLDDPTAVPGAVVSALGLRENTLIAREKPAPAADPASQLVEGCADRRLLIVLDNCEHVIGAAAELAELLLTHCPGVRILATSREPLGVPGESVRPLDPLPPDPATRLFADRAAAVRPGFTPADDPDAVAEICRRLDGLPLAIELAAARLRLLTPRQIADRLDDRFRLLTGGARTVLPRQQTLRAVVDWSWDLLDEPERAVLRRLSVFAGGCDLAAAEAVCGERGHERLDVADALGALVDKSLVIAAPTPDGMRYHLLETIHEYAAERAAADASDHRATAGRHAAHFLALAEEAEPILRSAAQLPWIRRMETELDNLRAALHHTTETAASDPTATDPAATEAAQRLALALGWFWWLRDYRREGARWAARIAALTPTEPADGTPAYWRLMRLQLLRLNLDADGRPPEEFTTPWHLALGDRLREAFRRGGPEAARFPAMLWPMTSFLTGGTLDFRAGLDATVANCRRHGGDWELGVTLMLRTHVAIDTTGGLSTVDADLAELHEIAARVGDRWIRSQVASAAGEVALSRGRYDWARTEYEECLRLAREVGAHTESPFAIARIAETALCQGEYAEAERLLADAHREAERYGTGHEIRAYGGLLAALIAMVHGDLAQARDRYDFARAAVPDAPVPPQLTAGLDNAGALLAAREQGPAAGLARIGPALAAAVTSRCAERVLASMADTAAVLLEAAGRPAASVRVLAAATAWRAGHPRSVPEQKAVAELPAQTRAALGPEQHAREAAAGERLSPPEVAALLAGS